MRSSPRVVGRWLAAALALTAGACGSQPDFGTEIVNPDAVEPKDFYPVVGLIYKARFSAQRRPLCSGVLIERDIVLTAAHCACGDFIPTDVYIGWDEPAEIGPGYYEVPKGAVRAGSACRSGSTTGRLKAFRDLAVVRTIRPVTETLPLGFADDAVTASARSFRIVGFGATDAAGKSPPGRKYQGVVNPLSLDCRVAAGLNPEVKFGCMPEEEIVASSAKGTDTCKGDSGGPLLLALDGTAGPATLGKLRVAGITSRGVKDAKANCGEGGIYERLDPAARSAIAQMIAELRG